MTGLDLDSWSHRERASERASAAGGEDRKREKEPKSGDRPEIESDLPFRSLIKYFDLPQSAAAAATTSENAKAKWK